MKPLTLISIYNRLAIMKIVNLIFPIVAFFILATICSCSEKKKNPFQEEIEAYSKSDDDSFPPTNAILFVGSSSFRLWHNIEKYFPDHTIINRGFGGSGLNDLILYEKKIITPYKPKQIIIYCGENDIAMGATATEVLVRFTELFNTIKRQLPGVSVAFVSIKPSPSRAKYQRIIEDANIMIRQFLSSYPETVYVDVYHPMLDDEGNPRKELFVEDDLHMNEKGYELWREAILPYLSK